MAPTKSTAFNVNLCEPLVHAKAIPAADAGTHGELDTSKNSMIAID